MNTLHEGVQILMQSGELSHERRLLVCIDPSPTESSELLKIFFVDGVRRFGGEFGERLDTARNALGQELKCIVLDARDEVSADVIGALAGSVRAGGLFVIFLSSQNKSHFNQRILRLCSDVPTLNQGHLSLPTSWTAIHQQESREFELTTEQNGVIQGMIKASSGVPLVLTAARGRGKTTTLAYGVKQLIDNGISPITVCAPTKTSVNVILQNESVHFQTFGDLLDAPTPGKLFIIDEAAAFPIGELQKLAQIHPEIVFSTTTDGYEGTGRGFWIKFRPLLSQVAPDYQSFTLTQPFRYSSTDPVEALIHQILLLDSVKTEIRTKEDTCIEVWTPSEVKEEQLSELFSLLKTAHYRTAPSDLQALLDDDSLVVLVALQKVTRTVVGALVLQIESILPDDVQQEIKNGTRRPAGHMLQATLASHGGADKAVSLKMGRIVRIAVHEDARRQGIGSQLILAAVKQSERLKLDVLGSTFGLTLGLIKFWRQVQFVPLRLGVTKGSATGLPSLVVATGLSGAGLAFVKTEGNVFAERFSELLLGSDLPAEVSLEILQASVGYHPHFDERDLKDLKAVALGQMGVLHIQGLAARLITSSIARSKSVSRNALYMIDAVIHRFARGQHESKNAHEQKIRSEIQSMMDEYSTKPQSDISKRKDKHLAHCLTDVESGESNGLERVKLEYNALPECSLHDVDLTTELCGKTLVAPLIIGAMTGGSSYGGEINHALAEVASSLGIGLALGSYRAGLRDENLVSTYQVEKVPLLFANLGAAQVEDNLQPLEHMLDLTNADALFLHLNPLQEAIQAGGDTNFCGVQNKIEYAAKYLSRPVFVKEVGHGISKNVAQRLSMLPIAGIETAGVGGTSFSLVEAQDTSARSIAGRRLAGFGIKTADSIENCVRVFGCTRRPVLASGGIRTGLDIARALALGATAVAITRPCLLELHHGGVESLRAYLESVLYELKTICFACGVTHPTDLQKVLLVD